MSREEALVGHAGLRRSWRRSRKVRTRRWQRRWDQVSRPTVPNVALPGTPSNRASLSFKPVNLLCTLSFLTAMARAFLVPTMTRSFLARLMES